MEEKARSLHEDQTKHVCMLTSSPASFLYRLFTSALEHDFSDDIDQALTVFLAEKYSCGSISLTDSTLVVTELISGLEENWHRYKSVLLKPLRRDGEENILFYE